MTIELITADSRHVFKLPYDDAPFVESASWKCKCGSTKIAGKNQRVGHDRVESAAHCLGCLEHVGTLRVTVSTIFGIEEDARVLNGRCRVY